MKNIIKRTISAIAATTFSVFAILCSNNANSVSVSESEDFTIDVSSKSVSSDFSENDIPECLSYEVLNNNKFAARLYGKEVALDTVLFANNDGTETVYIFNEDVKYMDENGSVFDKSNKLYPSVKTGNYSNEYSYVNKENNIKTYLPKSLKTDTGVIVEAQNKTIEMYPASDSISDVVVDDDMYGACYYDVFGEDTEIRYKPSFSGYKEDIVLLKNTGNVFTFFIETTDLVPALENGVIYFLDDDGAEFGYISPTYVYDSFMGDKYTERNQHFTYNNSFELINISEGKYKLSVIVDEDFLNDSSTVYPVIVDPSITIRPTGSGSSKSILDTPIYNGGISGTAGVNALACIGYVDSSYGTGRLLMRFPGLMTQSVMTSNDYTILSAKLTMTECSGKSTSAKIYAYDYTGPAWDESTKYSSPVYNGVGNYIDYWSFSYPNYVVREYNLTSSVKNWKKNYSQASKGIILKNNTSETDYSYRKDFYTTEGSVQPYLSVTYNIENTSFSHAQTISLNTKTNVNITESNQQRYYTFIAPKDGYYSIESSDNGSCDPLGYLCNAVETEIDKSDDHGGNRNFHIIMKLEKGLRYYIKAGCYSSSTGSYKLKVVAYDAPGNVYTKGQLSNRIVTIQLKSGLASQNGKWKSLIEAAQFSWNRTKAGVQISLTTEKSPYTITVNYQDIGGNIAITNKWLDSYDKYIVEAEIIVNVDKAEQFGDNGKQGIIAHEMGHLFGLDDNPDTTEPSLMSYSRNRDEVYVPQPIDIYHVIYNYNERL